MELTASNLKLSCSGDCQVVVSFDIRNTGELVGSTVGQVYVHQARPSVEKPDVELAGFAKLYLEPGETGTASVTLDASVHSSSGQTSLMATAQSVLVLQCSTSLLGRREGRLRDQDWDFFPGHRSDQAFPLGRELDVDRTEGTSGLVIEMESRCM